MMKYIDSLRDMSRSQNAKIVFMPVETSNVLSSIGAFKEMFAESLEIRPEPKVPVRVRE